MTCDFYYALLEYISPKEKALLLGHIQKHKVRIDGFRAIKDVPSKFLSLHFSRNENLLFEILKEYYPTAYNNEEDAINDFSPNSAVKCFTYLIQANKADENKLMSLMKASNVEVSTKTMPAVTEKEKKKSDEFRKKYLTTYKKLETTNEQLKRLSDENKRLSTELESQRQRTILLEKDIECKDKEYREMKFSMQQKIDKLKSECERLSHIAYIQSRKILVISNSNLGTFEGVTILPYDRISELDHMVVSDYSEIIYIPNDMPFPCRRRIQKMNQIQEKLRLFSTHTELVDYLKNGRK